MFNQVKAEAAWPKYISTDNDPLFRFHRWRANLRILDIDEIKSIPFVPSSHPFVERLIGTLRREYLDRLLIWNGTDLLRKLLEYRDFYNAHRCPSGLDGKTPNSMVTGESTTSASLQGYRWAALDAAPVRLPGSRPEVGIIAEAEDAGCDQGVQRLSRP